MSEVAPATNMRVLEQGQRLSRSILWECQREYFERKGIDAWRGGDVPHNITNNPFIADAYVDLLFAFLQDLQRRSDNFRLDPDQPVHIIELGSGTGRFAYSFIKKFLQRQKHSTLNRTPLRYVMTDFAEQTIQSWHRQEWFRPFVSEGLLDFAQLDVERDSDLTLINSKSNLSGALRNPPIIIANYLFDGIPQDAFYCANGELFETLIDLSGTHRDDPEFLTSAQLTCRQEPVNGTYYSNAEWNRLLQNYRQRVSGRPFLFPTGALHCMEMLEQLCDGRFLLLAGDRGYVTDEDLWQGKGALSISVHGSFSLPVDFRILGEYCLNRNGLALYPKRPAENINIAAFIFEHEPDAFFETRHAYTRVVERFGPDDLFTLKLGVEQFYEQFTLDQIIAFLRLSCWDFSRFWECLPALKEKLNRISDSQKRALQEAIQLTWDSYLPIGEEKDLAFEMGTLLLEMDCHADALEFLQRSADLYGMAPGTAYNMAVCCYGLGQMKDALEYVDQALEMDGVFTEAKTLRTELESVASTAGDQRSQLVQV